MYPAMTLKDLGNVQGHIDDLRVVMILFIRPDNADGNHVIGQFNFMHYQSGNFCTIFAPGYAAHDISAEYSDTKEIKGPNNVTWYYSDKAFLDFVKELKARLPSWRYQNESSIMLLQSQVGKGNPLNFSNYMCVEIAHGIRQGYLDSFDRFMSELMSAVEAEVTIDGVQKKLLTRMNIRDIVISAIDASKRIPIPVKKIMREKLFIRTANQKRKD